MKPACVMGSREKSAMQSAGKPEKQAGDNHGECLQYANPQIELPCKEAMQLLQL
jgi:hypothetical protein